ncbi:MAG: hypothetical protein OXS28_08660 [Gammaproteobacteria bacterium]|nr:hypothetical protein [Gammaproteobacteria bacterium]
MLFAMIMYSSYATMSEDVVDIILTRGYKEISLCINEYTRLTGESISDEIDRVYLEVFKNLDGLLFTKGAVGTFGKRSPTYGARLSCAVKNDRVIYLEVPLRQLLIHDSNNDISKAYEEYHQGTVIELLYLRNNDRFEFCCSQPFNLDNIDKHNPDLRQRQLSSGTIEVE